MAKNREENRRIVERVLREKGFSDIAISASLSRMNVESGFDPKAHNPNDPGERGSRALFQWNRDRLDNLERFAKDTGGDPEDIETQARFFAAEVLGEYGTEGKRGRRLLAARTPLEAAEAIMGLARPKGYTPDNPSGGLGWDKTVRGIENLLGAKADLPSLTANQPNQRETSLLEAMLIGSGVSDSGELYGRRGARDRSQGMPERNPVKQPEVKDPSPGQMIVALLATAASAGIGSQDGKKVEAPDPANLLSSGMPDITSFLRRAGSVGPDRIR